MSPDPASPGPDRVRLVDVRDTALSLDEVFGVLRDPAAGGLALFVGTVRDHDEGRDVTALDYSSHPTAVQRMREVAERVAAEEDVVAVAAVHRVGPLSVGDLAVVVGVSAGHRQEAFAAARRLIDEVKAEVPVWKHQTFESGEAAWVGAC